MNTTTSSPQQSHRAADVLRLLQTAFPKDWENHLRNIIGVTDPRDLSLAELARFTDRVFWHVKQMGIKDPAAWLITYRAREDARMAALVPVEIEASVEIAGEISVQRDSVELEPVKLGVEASGGRPPTPVAATFTSQTTKAELLSRARAAIADGERSLRDAAETLALAQKDFDATQREMAEAVGRSASWVNRLLKMASIGIQGMQPVRPHDEGWSRCACATADQGIRAGEAEGDTHDFG
jgi:HEAT repeat protein